jgi:hypothetical protein
MFFNAIKAKLNWRRPWETCWQAETAFFEYINGFYDPRHGHSEPGGTSPVAFAQQMD